MSQPLQDAKFVSEFHIIAKYHCLVWWLVTWILGKSYFHTIFFVPTALNHHIENFNNAYLSSPRMRLNNEIF